MVSLGRFILFLQRVFHKDIPSKILRKRTVDEAVLIGINSIFIISVVSVAIGAVTGMQLSYNLKEGPFVSKLLVGFGVREMTILELSPALMAVVFAGKIGSSIAGQLGTMRITEQVDALDVMGINSASYLILPKIVAALLMFPLLVIWSMGLALLGGYMACMMLDLVSSNEYIQGLQFRYHFYSIQVALYKALVFSFIVTSISSFQGYHTRGGALEVGASSTQAVTLSCIFILLADALLTKILL